MDAFVASYEVEFAAPRQSSDWPLSHFEAALAQMLAEETLAMRADGESMEVHLGAIEGIGRRIESPRRAFYSVAHSARFESHGATAKPVEQAELVRRFLAEALGVAPRQSEGPWNIIGLEVRPADNSEMGG